METTPNQIEPGRKTAERPLSNGHARESSSSRSLDLALALCNLGCYVFPSKSKRHHISGWQHRATNNPQQVFEWFGPGGRYEDWRVSIYTGRFGSDASLLVVDVDRHNDGFVSLTKVEVFHDLPKTRTHATPRGGQHWLYVTPYPGVKSGTHVLGKGLDLRSAGGLIHVGDGYRVLHDEPIVEAPAWLVGLCSRATVSGPADRSRDVIDPDQERAWQLAEDMLDAWPMVSEGSRNDALYQFICQVRERAATNAATTEAIGLAFCDRCNPPFPYDEGRTTIRSAIKGAKSPAGSQSPVPEVRHEIAKRDFQESAVLDPMAPRVLHPFQEINKEYSLVMQGGYPVLLRELLDIDVDLVNLDHAPLTAGLLEQKEHSLSPIESWWLGCLETGRIAGDLEGWPSDIDCNRFRQALSIYAKERNISTRIPADNAIGRLMKKFAPGFGRARGKAMEGVRPWVYRLPDLDEARQGWAKHMGQDITWPE